MTRKEIYTYATGSFVCFATGLATAFFVHNEPLADWHKIIVALYWAFLCSCIFFLLSSAIPNFRAQFPKLTTYFQIWGTLGTFGGLIVMCNSVASSVSAGDTSAIQGALSGFATAVITSMIGMVLALCNDILPEVDDKEKEEDEEEDEEEEEDNENEKEKGKKKEKKKLASEEETSSKPAPLSASLSVTQPAAPVTQAVPQTVVYQAVMPPITTATPIVTQAAGTSATSQNTPGKGGTNNGTP